MTTRNIASLSALTLARYLERGASLLRGKGYGSHSISKEVDLAVKMAPRTPGLVIDVGGNRGEYAAAMRKRVPDSEIVIFEPARGNCQRLAQRFANDRRISVEPHGLSNQESQATLYTNEEGSGIASLSKRDLSHIGVELNIEESISLITFDRYWANKLDRRPIDIMKFDVEGHELSAMQGSTEALKHTAVIQFEFGGCNIDSRTFFKDFYQFLQQLSFEIFRITPLGLEPILHYTEDMEFFITTNFLARRRP